MEFDEIIKSMTSKLTGNYKGDMDLLNNESEKYKNHECYLEIIEEIGGLTYDLLHDSDKRKIEELYVVRELDKMAFMIRVNKSDEALVLFASLIKQLGDTKWHLNDDKNGCYNILRRLYVSYSEKVSNMKK